MLDWVITSTFLLLLLIWTWLRRTTLTDADPVASFGDAGAGRTEAAALVVIFAGQQRWAFAVCLVALAASILLGIALLVHLAVVRDVNVTSASQMIAAAGNLWLGRRAFVFYERVSGRLEAAVERLRAQE